MTNMMSSRNFFFILIILLDDSHTIHTAESRLNTSFYVITPNYRIERFFINNPKSSYESRASVPENKLQRQIK